MVKSKSSFEKVIVKWKDAFTYNDGAIEIQKAIDMDMPVRETIGYLIYKDKYEVVIAGFYDHEDQQVDVFTHIPRQWCMEINKLK
jgi:hypothetical protein